MNDKIIFLDESAPVTQEIWNTMFDRARLTPPPGVNKFRVRGYFKKTDGTEIFIERYSLF